MNATSVVVIGWIGEPWRMDLVPEPEPAANLVDPVKKRADVEKKKAKALDAAPQLSIVGRVAAVHMSYGDKVITMNRASSPLIAQQFVETLSSFGLDFSGIGLEHSAPTIGASFCGFNVKGLFRQIGLELLAGGVAVPLRLWYDTPGCYDPYEMLVQSPLRDMIDLYGLCSHLGIQSSPSAEFSAAEKWSLAKQLVARGCLFK